MTENHAQPSPANPDDVVNPLLLQAFAWDLPADSTHWRLLADNTALLADCGVSSVWLPPAYKGQAGMEDVGYGVYDTYDLGEFDQKGTVPTKYGTKEDYLAAIEALHAAGISVVADIVLNHRMGGDATEVVRATPVDPHDRKRPIGETEEITAWTRYTFPGRAGAYSDFTWDWTCFHGTDWDEARHQQGVWLFEGKQWNENVNDELGNYDYLMGSDVHVIDPAVSAEMDRWGRWYVETTGVDALRLDAIHAIFDGGAEHLVADAHGDGGRTGRYDGGGALLDAGRQRGQLAAAGERVEDYLDVEYSVSESRFNHWPAALRAQFEPARTVKPGKPTFRLALDEEVA